MDLESSPDSWKITAARACIPIAGRVIYVTHILYVSQGVKEIRESRWRVGEGERESYIRGYRMVAVGIYKHANRSK